MTAYPPGTLQDGTWDAMANTAQSVGARSGPEGERGATEARTLVLVSADAELRQRLGERLKDLRWRVLQAGGGATAMLHLEAQPVAAILIDGWLPDLEVHEFTAHVRLLYPETEQIHLAATTRGGDLPEESSRNIWRNELQHAIREARDGTGSRYPVRRLRAQDTTEEMLRMREPEAHRALPNGSVTDGTVLQDSLSATRGRWLDVQEQAAAERIHEVPQRKMLLPDLVGESRTMREMARMVHLVAPRSTTVLIEGETGTGKEVVARALHRLSARAGRPFAVLNCAAIPESLLEAELFGHTRGAFTGAVQSRMGRIEAADGGTLLLDEIGEMPVGMQAKMLRFLESGELQRVGGNEMTRVDVRLIAATHQPIQDRSDEGTFRLDLYHRLAVFPIHVPPLRERMEDIAALSEFFLEELGQESPRKRLAPGAAAKLQEHSWPGNVRELMHVLERATILAGASPEIAATDIRYRRATRG